MEWKARENLEAAEILLATEDPCPNAATSRAYYAAYHACWTLLVDEGYAPPATPRGAYFPHSEIAGMASAAGVLTRAQADEFRFLEAQRVAADYYSESLTVSIARDCLEAARMVVSLLGDE